MIDNDTKEATKIAADLFSGLLFDPYALHDSIVCMIMAMGVELEKRGLQKPLIASWLTQETYLKAFEQTIKLGVKTSISPTSPKDYILKRISSLIEDTVDVIEEDLEGTKMQRPCIWVSAEVDPITSVLKMWSTYFMCTEKPGKFSLRDIKKQMKPVAPKKKKK